LAIAQSAELAVLISIQMSKVTSSHRLSCKVYQGYASLGLLHGYNHTNTNTKNGMSRNTQRIYTPYTQTDIYSHAHPYPKVYLREPEATRTVQCFRSTIYLQKRGRERDWTRVRRVRARVDARTKQRYRLPGVTAGAADVAAVGCVGCRTEGGVTDTRGRRRLGTIAEQRHAGGVHQPDDTNEDLQVLCEWNACLSIWLGV
jgi:hypothetical protein